MGGLQGGGLCGGSCELLRRDPGLADGQPGIATAGWTGQVNGESRIDQAAHGALAQDAVEEAAAAQAAVRMPR
jgi:hypothetical protein